MAEPARILIFKLSALGDLFHAMPAAHLLATQFQTGVDWVTQPEYADLISCHQDVRRVITFPRRGGPSGWRRFLRELRAQEYDLALDLQGLAKSGLGLGLCRSQRKISPSRRREGAGCFARERAEDCGAGPHAIEGVMDSLRHLGLPTTPRLYPLQLPETPLLPSGCLQLALAPRSRWPAKDWPLTHYVAMASQLQRTFPLHIHILGGAADRGAGDQLAEQIGPAARNRCGEMDLPSLGGFLRRMDLLVCNDSGPMHYASALGTPLLALFGPTDPALTGPTNPQAVVLRPEAGQGGYPDSRAYKNGDCRLISRLSVGEVTAAAESLLHRISADRLHPDGSGGVQSDGQ